MPTPKPMGHQRQNARIWRACLTVLAVVAGVTYSQSPALGDQFTTFRCTFSEHCWRPGKCEPSEGGPMSISYRKEDPSRVIFDRVSAEFWIKDGTIDDNDTMLDVTFRSELSGRHAWFGSIDGRFEMISIDENGSLLKTVHYHFNNTTLTSFGTCEKVR